MLKYKILEDCMRGNIGVREAFSREETFVLMWESTWKGEGKELGTGKERRAGVTNSYTVGV